MISGRAWPGWSESPSDDGSSGERAGSEPSLVPSSVFLKGSGLSGSRQELRKHS